MIPLPDWIPTLFHGVCALDVGFVRNSCDLHTESSSPDSKLSRQCIYIPSGPLVLFTVLSGSRCYHRECMVDDPSITVPSANQPPAVFVRCGKMCQCSPCECNDLAWVRGDFSTQLWQAQFTSLPALSQ